MTWVAVAIAGSAVIGGIASDRAASKQAKAVRKSREAQNEITGPFTEAGKAGIPAMQAFVDEGGNFRDTQAFKDITNSSKANVGGLAGVQSGSRETALASFFATNFRPQRQNELMALINQGANVSVGQATNVGNSFSNQGAAEAAGVLGVGQAGIAGINALQFLNRNPTGFNQGVGVGSGVTNLLNQPGMF